MGKTLEPGLIQKAADAALAKARPMEQNGYKVPLFKAVLQEELQAMAS